MRVSQLLASAGLVEQGHDRKRTIGPERVNHDLGDEVSSRLDVLEMDKEYISSRDEDGED